MITRTERASRAVELAATLLREAQAQETADEKAQARRLARMMEDPRGKELTIAAESPENNCRLWRSSKGCPPERVPRSILR